MDPHQTVVHLFKDPTTYERFKKSYDAIADTSSTANMNIVSYYDCMMDRMKSSGQVQEHLLPPHVLGVHPAKRGDKMMNAHGTGRSQCPSGHIEPIVRPIKMRSH